MAKEQFGAAGSETIETILTAFVHSESNHAERIGKSALLKSLCDYISLRRDMTLDTYSF